jgi:iron complex outermembrane receptor protein
VRLDLARGRWRLRTGYQGRRDVGTGAGINRALDPVGHGESDRINADLTYYDPRVAENWDFTARASYLDVSQISRSVLFPPGAFAGAFPEGVIGNPDVWERHYRLDLSSFYTGFQRHRLRLGWGLSWRSL